MNDINWRELNEESIYLLRDYPNNQIIVLTDVTERLSRAKYVNLDYPHRMDCFGENALKFAFFE